MTCDELERALKDGLDREGARDACAHVATCDRCASAVVAWAMSDTFLPSPPIGFAHLAAVTASVTIRPAVRSRRPIVVALVTAVLASVAFVLWILNAHEISGVTSIAVMTCALIVVEASVLAGGLLVWLQSPPMRRRT
jgi:anti-sigma factor RsiW